MKSLWIFVLIWAVAPSSEVMGEADFGWTDGAVGTVHAIAAVERIEVLENGQVYVYCARGIATLGVRIDAGGTVEIQMLYAPERPFTRIEGVDIIEERTGAHLDGEELEARGVLSREQGRIRINAWNTGLWWRMQVIDFYR